MEPLNLAEVSADDTFHIDPALIHDEGLFLPETDDDLHKSPLDDLQPDTETSNLDDAAVKAIKASLSQAQAQAAQIQLQANDDAVLGSESNPVQHPPPQMAPFSKSERDENTPHPEHIFFIDKVEFDKWLKGESSWCHFVQRRTTTPQRRSEERMKQRQKAHEKALMEMTPDEAANAPPLKKRRRLRTSTVHEKITYTCHHAGTYSSKHSVALPENKLRKKTKRSVKCNCPARVVLTELQGTDTQPGQCKVQYFWKHEGHDPFEQGELDTGRLPTVVDDWLVKQIHAGKDTESIRKLLSISEKEKTEYLRKVAEDPTYVDPELPPPLAFQMKVKYPDIYNRYRKIKGPIRSIKIPKSRRNARNKNNSDDEPSTSTPMEDTPEMYINDDEDGPSEHVLDEQSLQVMNGINGLEAVTAEDHGVDHQFDVGDDGMGHGMDLSGHEMLAELANQHGHVDLAQALLRLPGAYHQDDGAHLEEEVLKMASITAAASAEGDDHHRQGIKPEEVWDEMNPL